MSANLKKSLAALSKHGPYRVLSGDLAYAGVPGRLYTPEEGSGIPGVAFAHAWLKKSKAYDSTLRHLASWGIAVAAPDTESGFNPSHRGFSADLDSALQILGGVRLGNGNVTVSPTRLGVVGHGMGAGCAILTAQNYHRVKAVVAAFPSVTSPSCEYAARGVDAPGLVIGSGKKQLVAQGYPATVAKNYGGPVVYREMDKADHESFSEDTLFKLAFGLGGPQRSARETERGLITGFLLHQLGEQKRYAAFSDPEATAKGVTSLSGEELEKKAEEEDPRHLPDKLPSA